MKTTIRRLLIVLLAAALLLGGEFNPSFDVPTAEAATWYWRSYSWSIGDLTLDGAMWKVKHYVTWQTTDPGPVRTTNPPRYPTTYRIRYVSTTCWVAKSIVYSVHIDKCGKVPDPDSGFVSFPGYTTNRGSLFRVCLGLGDIFNAACWGFESAVYIRGSYVYQWNDAL